MVADEQYENSVNVVTGDVRNTKPKPTSMPDVERSNFVAVLRHGKLRCLLSFDSLWLLQLAVLIAFSFVSTNGTQG